MSRQLMMGVPVRRDKWRRPAGAVAMTTAEAGKGEEFLCAKE